MQHLLSRPSAVAAVAKPPPLTVAIATHATAAVTLFSSIINAFAAATYATAAFNTAVAFAPSVHNAASAIAAVAFATTAVANILATTFNIATLNATKLRTVTPAIAPLDSQNGTQAHMGARERLD